MTERFYRQFEMNVRPSQRTLRRLKRGDSRYNFWEVAISDSMIYDRSSIAEEVKCVEVFMPEDKLIELEIMLRHYEHQENEFKKTNDVVDRLRSEQRQRIKNPVVQKAYDQYMTLLNLCWED